MISWGYCYGGDAGYSGYRPMGSAKTAKDAQDAILGKLAGQKVTFVESGDKHRAYADGQRTGYIYFTVKTEIWVAIDHESIGQPGEKAVIATGSLETVKGKVRKFVEKESAYTDGLKLLKLGFSRTGDHIKVHEVVSDVGYIDNRDARITILRVPA